jgi:hypothetical protein
MTEPKRWSESGSEVDPVLRSVARYAQGLEPDAVALRRLILATAPAKPKRPVMRRFVTGVAVGLAAAFGGAAWASYGGWLVNPARAPESAHVSAPAPVEPRSLPPRVAPAPAPSVAETPEPIASATPSTASAPAPSTSSSLLDDTALLQRARSLATSEPSRALSLTREHEARFPGSPLAEERQALRIEALLRLGKAGDAARELDAFEQRYPRSPYRRRLRSLLTPP